MSYRLEVDFTPAHEMILSLDAFLNGNTKLLEQGAEWVVEVEATLGPNGAEVVKLLEPVEYLILGLLASQCPSRENPEAFLRWYATLSPGDLYERVSPYVPADKVEMLRDLDATRDRHLRALTHWHHHYFRHVEPAVLERLVSEAEWRRNRVKALPPVDAIDEATNGLMIESEILEKVLLIPAHHYRPLNRYAKLGPLLICFYAVEAPRAEPGLPSADLLRLTRALGDENRLRILHYLADGPPRSFTEVQRFTELAKNTVHHHLAGLRSAGLVRVHLTGACGSDRYTARRASVDEIGPRLHRFLDNR